MSRPRGAEAPVRRAGRGLAQAAVKPVLIALVVWLGGLVVLAALQDRFIWFPQRIVDRTPAAAGLAFENVRLVTEDGLAIAGWFIPAEEPIATVLFLHGNAGNIGHRVPACADLHAVGCSVLIIDYRGYGESAGRPSEAGVLADAAAAWTYLIRERGYPAGRCALYGESIGAVPALALARRLDASGAPPGAVILEGAFTSALEMGRRSFPFLPVRWILRDPMDNLDAIGGVTVPTLIAHAEHDTIVPIAMGRRLHDASPAPVKGFHVIRRAGHNDRDSVASRRLRETIGTFLRSALVGG